MHRPKRAPAVFVIALTLVFGVSAMALIVTGIGRLDNAVRARGETVGALTADAGGLSTTSRSFTQGADAQGGEDAFTRYEQKRLQSKGLGQAQDQPDRFELSESELERIEQLRTEFAEARRERSGPSDSALKPIERRRSSSRQDKPVKFEFRRVERRQSGNAQDEPVLDEPVLDERTGLEPEQEGATQAEEGHTESVLEEHGDGGLATGQLEDPGPIRFYTGGWRTDFSISSVPFVDIRGGGPPRDGIPAIDAPVFESIDAARAWLDGMAPLIALEIGGQARAYPMAIMTWHEIVNDSVGGTPVAVTFCPLCNTALVFERTFDGVVHDFGTTGNLYLSNLVMYDRQTESWWQQAGGVGIVGELTGTQLVALPAQIISLDQFETDHPDGKVLSRDTGSVRPYGENPYPGYDRADQPPWNFKGTTDGRIAPKERVATAGRGDQAIAFAYPDLATTGVAAETVDGDPIVVFWTPGMRSALDAKIIEESDDVGATGVFSPVVDGRTLKFERLGPPGTPITDRKTGSAWSITGIATDGPLKGTRLDPIVSADHLWFSWAAFNPETRIWQPPKKTG